MTERIKLPHVYYEIRTYGKYLRVHAIDPDSGEEVISTGMISMGAEALKRNARQKLEYKLTRKMQERTAGDKNRNEWIG